MNQLASQFISAQDLSTVTGVLAVALVVLCGVVVTLAIRYDKSLKNKAEIWQNAYEEEKAERLKQSAQFMENTRQFNATVINFDKTIKEFGDTLEERTRPIASIEKDVNEIKHYIGWNGIKA